MDFTGELSMETGSLRGSSDADGGLPLRQRASPVDFDGSLEPMPRCRANTWPCRPNESVTEEENRSTPTSVDGDQPDTAGLRDPTFGGTGVGGSVGGGTRKAAARRNAWGNLSYADLITRAIESSPEKRLTLSQIYSWMVENVPFFKDKGDSNSSAGWKNSIRHNLSLHSRFMRVQNESTGKSSWWVINPDVKHLKTPRRRAATMDNPKLALQHRRNRLKGGGLPRVSSSEHPLMGYVYEGSSDHLDSSRDHMSPEMMGLASQSYRVRSSSNASSIGRLSPIPATAEHDLDDSQFGMPLPSSALSWKGLCLPPESGTETLSESLASIFVEDAKKPMLSGESCHVMLPDANILTQNGTIVAHNRANVNGVSQNGANVLAQNGNAMALNRSIIGQNGSIVGLPSAYSHGTVPMEGSAGASMMLSHRMWPTAYHAPQPSDVFATSSSMSGAPADVKGTAGLYPGDAAYSSMSALSRSALAYYGDNGGCSVGSLCRSSSDVGYPMFGVSSVSGSSPYPSPSLSELLKQEQKPASCFYAGSNGDPAGGMPGGMSIGMTSPLRSSVKVERPPGACASERSGLKQWPEQRPLQLPLQQQAIQMHHQSQQQPQLPGLAHSLGPIDPRKLMKILAEKPHLKEKMLQLIQQKRQQLAQQQQQPEHTQQPNVQSDGTLPGCASTSQSCIADHLQTKQNLSGQPDCLTSPSSLRPVGTSAVQTSTESLMPVDLDLDFDTTPAINCDIDQVIQHEMTFGELDFSLDQLQVTLSSGDMTYNNFHF